MAYNHRAHLRHMHQLRAGLELQYDRLLMFCGGAENQDFAPLRWELQQIDSRIHEMQSEHNIVLCGRCETWVDYDIWLWEDCPNLDCE